MTIPMDNTSDLSSGEHVQHLYNKNVELENRRRKAAQARIPSDPNAWQQMRENYEAIVLEDHAFSEQHEVEYALWQLHYRRIEELRAYLSAALSSTGPTTSQDGKGPTRPGPDRITKIRSQFKAFLSEATGFYHDLMVKIRAKDGLPLGDLARYKGLYGDDDSKYRDFAAASSYYMQASSLWPSSGNPHHQLAILASYLGDDLVAVYRYFRSLAVDNPFTTARDNLIIAFEKNRQSYYQLLGDAKAASVKTAPARITGKGRRKGETRFPLKETRVEATLVKERSSSMPETFKAFSVRFVRLNGVLFTRTSLETFEEVFAMARSDLLELLSSGPNEEYNFGSDAAECRLAIIRLMAILIFTVHNVNRETENQSYAEILQRSVLLQNAFTAIFEFMGHILKRYDEGETANRLALPEDFELRGFLPLLPAQLILDFSRKHSFGGDGGNKEKKARVQRIIAAGKALANVVKVGQEGIYFDPKSKRFAIGVEPQTSGDHLLSSSLEIATLNGMGQENIVESEKTQGVLQPKAQLCMEGEEEDEVIVFKPSVTEQYTDSFTSKLTSFEVIGSGVNASKFDLGSHIGSVSAPHDKFLMQNALNTSSRPPTSLTNITGQYLQPIQPSTSKWLVEQHGPIANGLTNLSLLGNGLSMKPGLQDRMGYLQPAPLSVPFHQSANPSTGDIYPVQIPETVIPCKFDSIMTSGGGVDSLSMNGSSVKPAGLRKNPVGRPVRHLGPPPGFSSAPSKLVDGSLSSVTLKSENPLMDDYSWLDGHQLLASTQSIGFNNSINHSAATYQPFSKSHSSTGMVSFPFPGKQVSTLQIIEGLNNLLRRKSSGLLLPVQPSPSVGPMLLCFCWSMDGLGVLQAPAIDQLVPSFPGRLNEDHGANRNVDLDGNKHDDYRCIWVSTLTCAVMLSKLNHLAVFIWLRRHGADPKCQK
ncbi:hypothetical protein F0562_017559 [Nyssa sinensis]|uniref:DNA/RNA-binding domain-containing protein n=1 Tax=Nyssa sinensis TaxID=561372 RepID=A0A5J4ZHZ1_9ASTE|nr:hypothetical protein F0562_017559 [Nyssa sinensis]